MKVRIKLIICGIFVLSGVCTVQGTTIIVDPNGSGDFSTIQAAIDNSSSGDEIIVPEAIYYETIDLKGKAITLRSTNPYDPCVIVNTIIDANGGGTTITCETGEGADTIIEGLTITGGSWQLGSSGGGMYCYQSSPTVRNCTFYDNDPGSHGGGMYCDQSNPTLINCMFIANDTEGDGGGTYWYQSSPTLSNCTFIDNEASSLGGRGGGMYCYQSNATLNNCTFTDHWADYGAGMFCHESSPILNNCTFTSNTAEAEGPSTGNRGGGMYCWNSSSPALNNCTFMDNDAANFGSAIYVLDANSSYNSSPKLAGTIVCGNNDDAGQIVGSFTDNGGNIIGEVCPPVPLLVGDFNGDRVVDFTDFGIFADNWLAGL